MNIIDNNTFKNKYYNIKNIILSTIGAFAFSTNVALAQKTPMQNFIDVNQTINNTILAQNYKNYPFQHVMMGQNCFVNTNPLDAKEIQYEVIPINTLIPESTSYNKLALKGSISNAVEESLNNKDKIVVNGKEVYAKGILTPQEIERINSVLMLRRYDNMAVLITDNLSNSPKVLLFGDIDCYEAQEQNMKLPVVQKVKPKTKTTPPKTPIKKESSSDSLLNVINKNIDKLEDKIDSLSNKMGKVTNNYNTKIIINNFNIIMPTDTITDTIRVPVKAAVEYKNKNALYLEAGPELLMDYQNVKQLVPNAGLGISGKRWGFGVTAGYGKFNTKKHENYPDIMGNGGTTIYHNINTEFIEYGLKANVNLSKVIYLNLGVQNHIKTENITSLADQIVYDDAGNERRKLCPMPSEKIKKEYLTVNPGIGANLNKRWSIYADAKFIPNDFKPKFYSGHAGIKYTIRRIK